MEENITMEERPVSNGLDKYSTKELRAELKRRNMVEKVQRELERNTALRCRNCVHCVEKTFNGWHDFYQCMARTWGKKIKRHYIVTPSKKACEKFEYKNQ